VLRGLTEDVALATGDKVGLKGIVGRNRAAQIAGIEQRNGEALRIEESVGWSECAGFSGDSRLGSAAGGQRHDGVVDAIRDAIEDAAYRAGKVNHAEGLAALQHSDAVQAPAVDEVALQSALGHQLGQLVGVGEVEHMFAVEVGQAVAGAQVGRVVAVIEETQSALLVGGVREGVRGSGLQAMAEALVHMKLRRVVLRDARRPVVDRLAGVANVRNAEVHVAAFVIAQVRRSVRQIDGGSSLATSAGVIESALGDSVAIGVILAADRIGGRGDLRLVKGRRDHLMAAQVAHIADLDGQRAGWLPLHAQCVGNRIRQGVFAIIDAHAVGFRVVVQDVVGVGQVLRNVGGFAGGWRSQDCAPGHGEVGVGRRAGRDIAVVVAEVGGVAGLRVDERRRLRHAKGSALDESCGVARREVGKQLAAVIIDAASSAHHQLALEALRRPGKAHARRNAPLPPGQSSVAGVLRDHVAVVGDGAVGVVRIACRARVKEAGIEVVEASILFAEGAVVVVAQTEGQTQIGPDLVLVLNVEAGLIGAVVAVAVALQEGSYIEVVVGGDQTLNELTEVCRRSGSGHAGTPVAGIQLGVRPASAYGQRMLAEGPDGVGRGHPAILKDAG